jgi:hypothetical protein
VVCAGKSDNVSLLYGAEVVEMEKKTQGKIFSVRR